MIDPKYIECVKKGDSVQYMQKMHTVQEYNNLLFIQYTDIDGHRKRLYIKNHPDYMFEFGSEPDWVFNEWWKIYPDYELFRQYALAEISWVTS